MGSAMVFAIQIYVVDRGGPLFVSAYLPLQTLLAALLATFALGEHFYLGGYAFMFNTFNSSCTVSKFGDEEGNHNNKRRSSVNQQPLLSS